MKNADWEGVWKDGNKLNPFGKLLFSRMKASVKNLLPSDVKTVLDVGCGSGLTMSFFREFGCDVTGIDVSDSALKISDGIKMDARKMKFSDGSFDLVFSDGLLEHFKLSTDFNSIVKEMCRVSKKYILICQPNPSFFRDLWRKNIRKDTMLEYEYSGDDYVNTFSKHGFSLQKSKDYNFKEGTAYLFKK